MIYFEIADLTISDQLVAERNARRAAEEELRAIRGTRSYRWMEPVRKLRAMGRRSAR